MDADFPKDEPLPPPKIHLSSSSPGYSVPIRAPLTIDSDSEFGLSINDQIYSRTSSFNSSSSIDISSYGDEHTSTFEDEHDAFVAYRDEEIEIERSHVEESIFTRPFVRYPDTNYVKERCDFGESTIFRPFVKIPCEESSSAADFGAKLSVPIAPLTRDCDSDSDNDIDSLDGSRSDFSGWIPDDGVVEKVAMAPEVRSFNGDEDEDDELQDEGVFFGDDITGIEKLNTISTESIENEGCKLECLNEDVKLSELDALSFDLEEINVQGQAVSSSNNETETINGDETDDELQIEGMFSGDDITRTENLASVLTELTENEGCEVECLNEVVNLSESDASSFNLERIDAHTVSSSNNDFETEAINLKLSESDEQSFDSEIINAQIVSNSDNEIENLKSVSVESIEYERFDVKLSVSDEPSFASEKINTQIVSNSESEIQIKTVNETKQEFANKKEEELLTKMQRVGAKLLRLALNEQLTTKVNGEGGNYNFDFSLTILAIGKTGVGKSATINSIFGEKKAITSAYDPGTTTLQEITGNVDGIQLRVIDTPGLKRSSSDRSYNLRILKSIKRFTRKHAPNIVLYVDRLDTQDVDDSHILKLITSSLGSSVWHSCIIALTHASCESCDPLNEPSGFVVQRCRFIQEQIIKCGGNTRHMTNHMWLVDNQLSYRHDVVDLYCGIEGLACLDQVNEDDGCDQGQPLEPMSEPQDVINRSVELNKGYFMEYGYRVKLFGNTHWSIGCRLCI